MFIARIHAAGVDTFGAGNSTSAIFESKMDMGEFILLGISLVVLFAGIFSIAYILWGGVLLILSGGKEDKIKPAINSIRYALIGLIVIVLSIFIFPKVAAMLGMDVTNYASPDRIFTQIKVLGDKFFGTDSSSTSTFDSGNSNIDSLPVDFSDL